MFQRDNLLDKLREIESKKIISEELTPEEQQELDALASEMDEFMGSDPELDAMMLDYQKISKSDTGEQPAQQTAQQAAPAAKGVDPKVQSIQKQLIGLGIDVGKTGADGKMGPATAGGIKAFEKMAGMPESGKITPELEAKLANGATIKSQNNLVASIDALEKLLTKYKLESIDDENDIDAMTEEEIKSFVMKHLGKLSESEKMEAMRLVVAEAGPRTAAQQSSMAVAAGNQLPSQAQAAAARFPAAAAAGSAPAAAAPSRLATFGKSLAGRVTGAGGGAKGAVKAGAKMGARLLPGVGWGLLAMDVIGAAMDALKDPAVQLDPADKAELDKHAAVLKSYLDDPEAAGGLPKDLQQRLTNISTRMQKMADAKTAPQAAPAAPAPGAAGSEMGSTVAA